MSQGLFELRKDAITGWWVATVVDRTFARERFALAAAPIEDRGDCFNCRIPAGDGIRLRTLKDFAFTVAGTEEEAHARAGSVAQVTIGDARAAGRVEHGGRPARRAPAAARRRLRDHRGPARALPRRDRGRPAGRPDAAPPGRPELGRPGGRAHEPPVLRPVRPAPDPAPDRGGAGRRGAVPDPRGRVPVLPARARGGAAARPPAVRGRPRRRLRAVRLAVAVRGVGRAAPPRRGLLARLATRTSPRPPRRCARCSAGSPPASTARRTTSSSTPRRSRRQVDATYHWHWEIHPRLREIAGLELGTGLPVNPVSPEDAVEELRTGAEAAEVQEHPTPMTRGGGTAAVTRCAVSHRHRRSERHAPDRRAHPIDQPEHPWSPIPSSSNSDAPCPWGSP